MKKLVLGLIGVGAMVSLAVVPAKAISYSLGSGNPAIAGFTGPYATAVVTLDDSTHARITFTSSLSPNGQYIYLMGNGGSVDVNVNASSWTLGTISGANAGTGFASPSYSDGGSDNISQFGTFNQTINNFDGYAHSVDSISFSLQNNSGTWANDAAVLTPNASGYSVAAHIFITTSPADRDNGAIVTGFAADGSTPSVPDGGITVTLLGFGMLALGGLRRRFAKE